MKSECIIGFGNNTELENLLSRYRVGDTVELELTGQVRSIGKEDIVLDITEVGADGEMAGEEPGGTEAEPVKPTAEEPVMVTIMKSRGTETETA